MTSLLYEDVTEDIIGAAMAVLNELKPGLDEKIYERALIIELKSRGRHVESQKQYESSIVMRKLVCFSQT